MASNTPQPELRRLGKYEILTHIATGGMGSVFKARDTMLGRTVALKILPTDLAAKPALLTRFQREARHAARLAHKNIVTLYECDKADDTYYLAMEYVEGTDLESYIRRRGKLSVEESQGIFLQALRALNYAFGQGLVHRDIKPANFLLTSQDNKVVVKLIDFGLARPVDEDEFRVTRAGCTVGTIDYMAPEQARDSGTADIRSDIYSMGCTLYHMLAGQPPFAEGGLGERIYKHMSVDPPDVRDFNPAVSEALWKLLRRMLAKAPDDRPQTPDKLLEEFRRVRKEQLSAGFDQTSTDSGVLKRDPDRTDIGESRTPVPESSKPTRVAAGGATLLAKGKTPAPLSAEEHQSLEVEFERARERIAAGDRDGAINLLLECCRKSPGNFAYRRALRQFARQGDRPSLSVGGRIGVMKLEALFRMARWRRDHASVLALGEELLLTTPLRLGVQTAMAAAAEQLGLLPLAFWLIEQAIVQAPQDPSLHRILARLYERQGDLPHAIAMWELVRKWAPHDSEAPHKIKNLAASEAIARGGYHSSPDPTGRNARAKR